MNARQEFEAKIIDRATTDSAFRTLLLEDPRRALQTISDVPPPPNLEIFVHEERATSIHLVLPDNGQLTEEDLAFSGAADLYPEPGPAEQQVANWWQSFH